VSLLDEQSRQICSRSQFNKSLASIVCAGNRATKKIFGLFHTSRSLGLPQLGNGGETMELGVRPMLASFLSNRQRFD
jgi:hypothetical protein